VDNLVNETTSIRKREKETLSQSRENRLVTRRPKPPPSHMHELKLGRAEPGTMAEQPGAAADATPLEETAGLENVGVQEPPMAPGPVKAPSKPAAEGAGRPHCDDQGAADRLPAVPAQRRTDQNLRAVTDGLLLQRVRREDTLYWEQHPPADLRPGSTATTESRLQTSTEPRGTARRRRTPGHW